MAMHLILLAAGEGSRMNSNRPKVLHEVAGLPLFAHALRTLADADAGRRVVVVGVGGSAVADAVQALDADIAIAVQSEQLGTAHAVGAARDALADADGDTVVLYGDTPFIRPETLSRMSQARADGHDVVVLGFDAAVPGGYGRLIVEGDALLRIVEAKDASTDELAVSLCNSGVVMARSDVLFDLVAAVGNDNAAGEFYLTDIVGLARDRGLRATVVTCDEAETMGVNTRADLARAEAEFQAQARAELMANGVTLHAPDTVIVSHDTEIGRDAVIEPHVVFGPGVTVESDALIRAFSHLEGCHVGARAVVGPYARLRPDAEIGADAKIGNFVEIKKAHIGDGAKVNHLSYIGDASLGEKTNVGAGTITCNYDGVSKHRTEIGANVFVGSNTMFVAPVRVGDDAMTATGTIVTRDVPDGDMAIGRVPQDNKRGLARRLFTKMRAAKAARTKDGS